MNIPFSETRDGLPLWRLQVDDPTHAGEAKVELAHRFLDFPQGGILALCLKVYDRPGRPALFHHALAFGSIEFLALTRHDRVVLVFEKKGWMSDAQKVLALDLSDWPALGEGQAALSPYLEAYRRLQTALGSPEAAWDAIEGELKAPVIAAVSGWPLWLKVLLALLGLGVLGGLYFFLR
jgi:hypothetical protein